MTSEQHLAFKLLCEGWIGKPYRWGGDDPIEGTDCSGLVLEFLWSLGKYDGSDITAQGIWYWFEDKCEAVPQASKGTLLFYGKSVSNITHIGIALGPTLMIHAGGGNSQTTSRETAARQNAYVKISPIDYRPDLVDKLDPWSPTV